MSTTDNRPTMIPLPPAQSKTIAELAAEQGVELPQDVGRMVGAGADLWDNDEEFEEFLRWLDDPRRKGA